MNYYEHHIGDYDQATAHLTAVEDGIYCRLLRKYYAIEKPLQEDVIALQRLVRAREPDEKAAVETVLAEFFTLERDGWHQKRCDEDIARFRDKQAKARASAEARWSKQHSATSADAMLIGSGRNANASETHIGRNALQTPDTRHQFSVPEGTLKSAPRTLHVTRPDAVSASVWSDFLAIRRAKRAPVTQTAINGIAREAHKASISLADALAICCTRGWSAFKADWLIDTNAAPKTRPAKFDPVAFVNARKEDAHVVIDVPTQRVA